MCMGNVYGETNVLDSNIVGDEQRREGRLYNNSGASSLQEEMCMGK